MNKTDNESIKFEELLFEDVLPVDGGYPSQGVKGFTIPLPFGAANYGEAVKLVPEDVTASSVRQESYVRVPDCGEELPMFRLPGEELEGGLNRILGSLNADLLGPKRGDDNRGGHPVSHSNLYTVLEGVDMDGCTKSAWLKKKAITLVRWYRRLGLPYERDLPDSLQCGELRSAVRKCFSHVSEEWELSFKTIQKVERNCCSNCEPRFKELLSQWKSQRFQPVDVSDDHLRRFLHAFRGNVDFGWDRERRPFIPNGNATEAFKRRDGGNWNREEFSDSCRVELVFSSGKPRVVTLYSAENTRLLGPLHYSLYSNLQRKGWLLVGDPSEKDIRKLTGAKYLSFDYQSATDNIKTAYVKAAVNVLIERADHLSEDEIRALRVLSELRFDGNGGATRGQPMGSVMSFPLLCLINKSVVDMALTELLKRKEISFREWSSHPCLINGDDLLLREPRTGSNIREEIRRQGSEVGFVVNEQKTMSSDQKAEVNSTLFDRGIAVKKLNVSALWMKPEVNDVLGVAAQSCVDRKTFVKIVRANVHILSKQQDKMLYNLPGWLQKACRQDKKIRRAITALPTSRRPVEEGVIRMSERPDGYDLSREEEYDTMVEEIERVREMGIVRNSVRKSKFSTSFVPARQTYSSATRRPVTTDRQLIPTCYVRRFHLKRWEDIVLQELADLKLFDDVFDGSRIDHLVDIIRLSRLSQADRTPERKPEVLGEYVSVVC